LSLFHSELTRLAHAVARHLAMLRTGVRASNSNQSIGIAAQVSAVGASTGQRGSDPMAFAAAIGLDLLGSSFDASAHRRSKSSGGHRSRSVGRDHPPIQASPDVAHAVSRPRDEDHAGGHRSRRSRTRGDASDIRHRSRSSLVIRSGHDSNLESHGNGIRDGREELERPSDARRRRARSKKRSVDFADPAAAADSEQDTRSRGRSGRSRDRNSRQAARDRAAASLAVSVSSSAGRIDVRESTTSNEVVDGHESVVLSSAIALPSAGSDVVVLHELKAQPLKSSTAIRPRQDSMDEYSAPPASFSLSEDAGQTTETDVDVESDQHTHSYTESDTDDGSILQLDSSLGDASRSGMSAALGVSVVGTGPGALARKGINKRSNISLVRNAIQYVLVALASVYQCGITYNLLFPQVCFLGGSCGCRGTPTRPQQTEVVQRRAFRHRAASK